MASTLPEHNEARRSPGELHVNFLDSVRGLAALTVLCEHYVISFELPTHDPAWRNAWDYSPLHIFWDGAAAVSLFFVLSGLVLSIKHFSETRRPDLSSFSLPGYLLGRIFRLCPPYLAALTISALCYGLTTGSNPLVLLDRQSAWLDELWGHTVDLRGVIGEANLLAMPKDIVIIPQSWTLAIELQMSILVPLGVILASRSSLWLLTFTGVAIKLLGAPWVLFHFALGILLAKYFRDASLQLPHCPWLRRSLLAVGILLYTAGDTFAGHLSGDWGSILSALGAASILLYIIGSRRAKAVLNWPVLRFLGRVSYSFYLLHMLVLFCAMPLIWAAFQISPTESPLVWWLGLVLSMLFSLSLAAGFYRCIEVPSMTTGKALIRLARKPRAWAAAIELCKFPCPKQFAVRQSASSFRMHRGGP